MRSKFIITCFLLLFQWLMVSAQANLDFIKHLSVEQKKTELYTYIQTTYAEKDSLPFYMAKYHVQFKQDSLFIQQLKIDNKLFLNDVKSVGFASSYFLQTSLHNPYRKAWFELVSHLNLTKPLQDLNAFYFIDTQNPKKIQVNSYPNVLQSSVKDYRFSAMKSPIKAALLSALVPGLGKVYIGKTRIGVNAFFMNGVFAFQTYESIHKLGVKHPLSIINILLSSFFYASNVYGSYRDANYFKKEKLQQLNNDASNYYANEYFPVVF